MEAVVNNNVELGFKHGELVDLLHFVGVDTITFVNDLESMTKKELVMTLMDADIYYGDGLDNGLADKMAEVLDIEIIDSEELNIMVVAQVLKNISDKKGEKNEDQ